MSRCIIIITVMLAISFQAFAADREAEGWDRVAPRQITALANDSATILPDKSIQFDLSTAVWQEPAFHFSFKELRQVSQVRLEILADRRFPDRRIGRTPDITVMLFDLKPTLHVRREKYQTTEFVRCEYSAKPDDDFVHGLYDYASDTGWEVPKLKQGQESIELVFGFDKPVTVTRQDELILYLDAGGGEWCAPARIRFSFSDEVKKP